MSHFERYWDSELEGDVLDLLKDKVHYNYTQSLPCLIYYYSQFQDRYKKLHHGSSFLSTSNIPSSRNNHTTNGLLHRNATASDSDSDNDSPAAPESWTVEFDRYIKTAEAVTKDVDIVNWWGVSNSFLQLTLLFTIFLQLNASRYPTWASLSRDYLAIMASSVSSERSFSAAGITISKRRNRLKEDIVEALQCLKCLYHEDIIFREVFTSSEVEADMDITEILFDNSYGNKADLGVIDKDDFSWDQLVLDDDSDIEQIIQNLIMLQLCHSPQI